MANYVGFGVSFLVGAAIALFIIFGFNEFRSDVFTGEQTLYVKFIYGLGASIGVMMWYKTYDLLFNKNNVTPI